MANFNRKISLNKSEFSSLAESSEPIKTQKSVLNTPPPRKKTDRIDRAARALKSLSKKRDQTNSSFNNYRIQSQGQHIMLEVLLNGKNSTHCGAHVFILRHHRKIR